MLEKYKYKLCLSFTCHVAWSNLTEASPEVFSPLPAEMGEAEA
jgi:hypothetical protein